MAFYFEWEENYIVWLQSIGNGGFFTACLNFLNNMLSFFGEDLFAILVMGIVYWGLDKKRGMKIGFAVTSSLIYNNLIKNIFKRERPFNYAKDRIKNLRAEAGYSFPSAHSSSATSLYPTLATEYKHQKWLRVIAVVLPILIASSRNYVGAHWPTDVICGLALGLVVWLLTEFVFFKYFKNEIPFLIAAIIGLPGFFFCKTEDFFSNYGLLIGLGIGVFIERKFVQFENTKKWYYILLRTIGGGACFFGISTLLKLLIGHAFPEGEMGYLILRTVRYFISCAVAVGVYPLIFKPFEKTVDEKILKK